MTPTFSIICAVIGIIALINFCTSTHDEDESIFKILINLISASALIAIGIVTFWIDMPEAIDVYREKTELQVTYKVVRGDTIPTDSVVIWKDRQFD